MSKNQEKNWETIIKLFPFKGYIKESRKTGYKKMVSLISKWCPDDCKILDFGAGPCDKTAMFSLYGYKVTAFDTLEDAWHKLEGNKEKILKFSKQVNIDYILPSKNSEMPFMNQTYDVIMSHDVFEHFHKSPRVILNKLLTRLKDSGILAITVPNAANLRKRIDILRGRTNYQKYPYFYWYPGEWNGHVREYVRSDLKYLNEYLGLELLELTGYSLQLDVLPYLLRRPFDVLSKLMPSIRDSWMMICRKPENWEQKLEPNDVQYKDAFTAHYFDYSGCKFNWNE